MTTSSKTKTASSKKPSKKSNPSSKKISPLKKGALAFEKKVLSFARQEKLWQPNATIIVALSGGPDSIALFFFFLRLAKHAKLRLVIAHINYQLRGEDSQADEHFVSDLASQYKIPCHILRVQETRTDEATLRKIRYAFFEKVQKKETAQTVALAHHQNDQAETFLLQLFRGTGRTGLGGMLPKRGPYIRPFLQVTRQEILRYLETLHISYRVDTSNDNTYYMRNRIRHELLPLLQKEYQPNIVSVLTRTVHLLSQTSEKKVESVPLSILKENTSFSFSQKEFLDISPLSSRSFLRHLISRETGKTLSHSQTLEIEKFLKSKKNKQATLAIAGLKLTRKGDTVTLHLTPIKD